MCTTTFRPSERLAPFVRTLTIVDTDDPMTRTLVPETGVVLGFRFAGAAYEVGGDTLPSTTLAGMRRTARRMHTTAGGGIVLATLHPGAAPAFVDVPMHELFGASFSLDQLLPRADVERTRERVGEARTHGERAAIVDAFLCTRLDATRGDAVVNAAVRAIRETSGAVRVGALADTLGLSRDRLEKRFRRAVGATPKQLATILRVRRAVELHRRGVSLTQLAVDAGFYDQSHFTRELVAVTGEPPQRFFLAGQHC